MIAPVITGGTPPYTYEWMLPDGTTSAQADLSELTAAGDYVLSISDEHGCSASSSAALTQNKEVDDTMPQV